MNTKTVVAISLSLFSLVANAAVTDWTSNPGNWNNQAGNWANSSSNWNNNPSNWNNNPSRFGNERTIRDNAGNAIGYAVPKDGGGVNIYNNAGDRTGYVPDSQ